MKGLFASLRGTNSEFSSGPLCKSSTGKIFTHEKIFTPKKTLRGAAARGLPPSSPIQTSIPPIPFSPFCTPPPTSNALQTLAHNPSRLAAMPDLSTVCLPLSPQSPSTAAAAGGELAGEQPAAAAVTTAAVAVSASAEAEAAGEAESASGGDGAPVLPVECRWSGRVRSFAGAGEGAGAAAVPACPAPRRGGGKKPSSAPSPSSTVATAPAHPSGRPFEEYVKEWKAKKAALGVPAGRCELPFLTSAPKAVRVFLLLVMICFDVVTDA